MAEDFREGLIAAASYWSGWCTDYDLVLPELTLLSEFLLYVKQQMALDRDHPALSHQPPSGPLSARSGTNTRSDIRSPQMGAQTSEEEL